MAHLSPAPTEATGRPAARGAGDAVSGLPVTVRVLGMADYQATREQMKAFTLGRDAQTPDEIWLVEHAALYTLGQAAKAEHVLDPGAIPVVSTERGGQVTYHGPGQLVAYTLIDLRRRGIRIREFVTLLEQAILDTLAAYNVTGQRRAGAPGVYVTCPDGERKIAALGLKVVNGCTYHGLSLNVAMDLGPFERINPCGYPGLRCTDLATLGVHASVGQVATRLAEALVLALGNEETA